MCNLPRCDFAAMNIAVVGLRANPLRTSGTIWSAIGCVLDGKGVTARVAYQAAVATSWQACVFHHTRSCAVQRMWHAERPQTQLAPLTADALSAAPEASLWWDVWRVKVLANGREMRVAERRVCLHLPHGVCTSKRQNATEYYLEHEPKVATSVLITLVALCRSFQTMATNLFQ